MAKTQVIFVRVPRSLYRLVVLSAKAQGISINQVVVKLLAERFRDPEPTAAKDDTDG